MMRPRSANGRKRAERAPTIDRRFAARDRRPDAFALALGQARMPFSRSCAETGGEAVEKLRGKRDLRQEHERLALLSQGFGDRLEIDLGLARTGHALEQDGRERAVSDEADEIVGRGALVGVEARWMEIRIERRRAAFRRERDRLKRALGDEAVDDALEQAARAASRAWASARRLRERARTRARASVMRAASCRSRPGRTSAGGSANSPARMAVRKSMPHGAKVQRAVQSMKSRSAVRSGGQSRTSAIGFRLSPPAARADQTTPVATRAPSGIADKGAGFELRPGGAR